MSGFPAEEGDDPNAAIWHSGYKYAMLWPVAAQHRLGILALILGVLGVGLELRYPESEWAGFTLIALAVVAALVCVWVECAAYRRKRDNRPMSFVLAILIGALVGALGGAAVWAAYPRSNPAVAAGGEVSPTTPPAPLEPIEKPAPETPRVTASTSDANGQPMKQKPPTQNPPPQTVINAPGGIGISGGTVTNPTVNNFSTPNTVTFAASEEAAFIEYTRQRVGSVSIMAAMYEPRAMALATKLCKGLTAAGWKCEVITAVVTEFEGLELKVGDARNQPAVALHDGLLNILGIKADGVLIRDFQPDRIELWIGRLTAYAGRFR